VTAPEPRPRAVDAPALAAPSPAGLRPLARADFPLLSARLAEPHVARRWADGPELDATEAMYGGTIDGTEPAEVFVAHADGRPVDLAQRYRIEAYPDDLHAVEAILPVETPAGSNHYLPGPPEALGRGWGAAMIRAFAEAVWRDDPAVPELVGPVHAGNRASWRSLERAGFTRAARGPLHPDNPADSRGPVVYRLSRPPGR
jgi:aminoglycoside 6'-N-acetyltransferase